MNKLWMFMTVVGVVIAAAAIFGWMMFRYAKSMDRMDREPKYRRGWLFYGAAIYVFGI